MNRVWYTTTRNQSAVLPDAEDVGTAHHITRGNISTLSAFVHAPTLVPFSAYGARLRRISLVLLYRAASLVVQLFDNLAVAGRTYLLSLLASHLLGRVIERFTYMTGRIREGIGYFARRLVSDVADTPLGLRQHLGFAPLQPLPAFRAFHLTALQLRDFSKLLVTPLHRCLCFPSADQYRLNSISSGNECIDTQVNTDDSLLRAGFIWNFADEQETAHRQTGLHQPSRKGERQGDVQDTSTTIGQTHSSISDSRTLVGINHISILGFAPGITGVRLPIASQLVRGLNGLAKLSNDLLNTLRMKIRIPALAPLLPTPLGRPLPVETANTMMTLHQIIPQARRFLTSSSKSVPLRFGSGNPDDFYCSISHTSILPHGKEIVKYG